MEREKETENGKDWNTNRKKLLFMIMGVNKVKYTIRLKKYLKKKEETKGEKRDAFLFRHSCYRWPRPASLFYQ